MRRIKLLIVFLVFLPFMVASNQSPDDLQKVKDALVNTVLYNQELERQNANLTATIKKVADDLRKIQTVKQLDSLKVVYKLK